MTFSNITMILFFLTASVQATIHLQLPDGSTQDIHPSETAGRFGFMFSGIQEDVAKATGLSLDPCAFELYNDSGNKISRTRSIKDGSVIEVRTVRAKLPDGRFLTLTPGTSFSMGLRVSGADAFSAVLNEFRRFQDGTLAVAGHDAGHFNGIELHHSDVTLTLQDGRKVDPGSSRCGAKAGDVITVAPTEKGARKFPSAGDHAYTAENSSGTGAGLAQRLAAAPQSAAAPQPLAAPQPAASSAEAAASRNWRKLRSRRDLFQRRLGEFDAHFAAESPDTGPVNKTQVSWQNTSAGGYWTEDFRAAVAASTRAEIVEKEAKWVPERQQKYRFSNFYSESRWAKYVAWCGSAEWEANEEERAKSTLAVFKRQRAAAFARGDTYEADGLMLKYLDCPILFWPREFCPWLTNDE